MISQDNEEIETIFHCFVAILFDSVISHDCQTGSFRLPRPYNWLGMSFQLSLYQLLLHAFVFNDVVLSYILPFNEFKTKIRGAHNILSH